MLTILSLVPALAGFVVDRIASSELTPAVILVASFEVVIITFWAWLARKTWAGRRWARTLQTALLALAIASAVIVAVRREALPDAGGVVALALSAASVVLLWLPSSRAYIGAVTDTRRSAKRSGPVKPYLEPGQR